MSVPSRPQPATLQEVWQLQVYIAGMTLTAQRALDNLREICETHLKGRYTITVIDLLDQPGAAESAQIVAVPTIVRGRPLPERRIIGDLSQTERAVSALGIRTKQG